VCVCVSECDREATQDKAINRNRVQASQEQMNKSTGLRKCQKRLQRLEDTVLAVGLMYQQFCHSQFPLFAHKVYLSNAN
jgi:hypothetical protein